MGIGIGIGQWECVQWHVSLQGAGPIFHVNPPEFPHLIFFRFVIYQRCVSVNYTEAICRLPAPNVWNIAKNTQTETNAHLQHVHAVLWVCVGTSVLFNFGRSAAAIISHKEILIPEWFLHIYRNNKTRTMPVKSASE